MIFFFKSTNEDDNLNHPITVCSKSEQRAYLIALMNFKKNNFAGSPELIAL